MFFDLSLPAQFQHIVERYPQRVAIGSGAWQPTYAELDAASGQLAATLRGRCAHGSRIAILQKLDGFLINSILGVLKAGQTAAVFNTSDPLPRLRSNLLDVEPALIVSDAAAQELTAQAVPPGVPVMTAAAMQEGPLDEGRNSPADLAFLIQTSGSTGRAKWVMQTHRNLAHNVFRHNAEMRVQPVDRILLLASPSGSQALATMFCALLSGAALCPFPIAERGIIGLAEWLRQHQITIYISAASAFRHFLKALQADDSFPLVRLVKVGAEPILAADLSAAAKYFRDDCAVYCSYSSAEAGNMMQLHLSRDQKPTGVRLPLGKPADGIEMLLHDDTGQPVRDGDAGEIVVRSRFLSPGYWRNEKLTAARFSSAGISDEARIFRTGDLGRREPDGSLYCIGRRDDIVKIRGNGVDLAEVECAIAACADVQESAVCARPSSDGAVSLAAFVVARPGASVNGPTIRDALASALPDYMVPPEFIFLDRLPLNPHGKIDRGALLGLAVAGPALPVPGDLATVTEVLLARILQDVFGSAAVGRETNFFDLGGDSLTAALVTAKVQTALGLNLDMLDFVEHPQIGDLAGRIDALQTHTVTPALPALERSSQRSRYPLSFTQEGIWRYSQTPKANRGYTVARSYELLGPLVVDALREAMNSVVHRNEILRSTFTCIDGVPMQVVHPPEPVALPLIDLSGHFDARERGIAILREHSRESVDLDRGPLLRHKLIRIAPNEHWLLRLSHHILYDAWSWKLYFDELESVYLDKPLQSAALQYEALQYGDYAAWERRVFSKGSPFRNDLVEWWKNTLANQPPRLDLSLRASAPIREDAKPAAKPSEGWLWGSLDAAVKERLAQLARTESATHYLIGLTAFAALLAEDTGRRSVMVATHMTNRNSSALQNMQGNFARLVPICLEYPRAGNFLDWMSVVRKQVVAAQAHAQIPREELWDDLRAVGVEPPEVEVIFGGPGLVLPAKFAELDLKVHSHRFKGVDSEGEQVASMPWGFTLSFDLKNPEHQCELTFDARLYEPAKVRSFLDRYMRFLDRVSSAPDQSMEQMVRAASAGL